MNSTPDLTSYYNGSCPICGAEMRHYQRIAERAELDLEFRDLSEHEQVGTELGIPRDELFRSLHVRTVDGRILKGIDAFLPIWRRLPRFRWLAAVVGTWPVTPLARLLYDRMLAPAIYKRHVRRQRRLADQSAAVASASGPGR